jgi:two-component system response regulator AlgR
VRVLIVDDEPLARLRLRTLIDDAGDPSLQVTAEAADADEALLALRDQTADLVLLDIGLPGRDGLRLAQALRALPRPPSVVFVTAHAEHALRAFELEALDYLTKPVRRDRLMAALQRAQQRLALLQGAAPAGAVDPALVVSDRGRVLRLPVREVLYLRAEQKYVTLRTAEHSYVLDDALADLELRLGEGFIRVHRNALVALRAIRALELRGTEGDGWSVRVAPLDEWLAVSRRQISAVKAALQSRPSAD